MLMTVVWAASSVGDFERAQAFAQSIPGLKSSLRSSAMAALAQAATAAGEFDLAEAAAGDIDDSGQRVAALAALANAVATAGHLERARTLAQRAEKTAREMTDPTEQARAFTALAGKAEPAHASSLLACALTVGDWTELLGVLAQIEPSVLIAVSDEYVTAQTGVAKVT